MRLWLAIICLWILNKLATKKGEERKLMGIPQEHESLAEYITRILPYRLREGIPLKEALRELRKTYLTIQDELIQQEIKERGQV